MQKHFKKTLLMLLVLTMMIGMFPAASTQAAPGSDGYTVITTAAELDAIRNGLSGKYRLGADIDLSTYAYNTKTWTSAKGWLGIGETEAKAFTGILDGDGYKISGLWSKDRGSNQGLFGWLKGAEVKNLTIELTASGISGSGERKGALAGNAYYDTYINNVNIVGQESGGSNITGSANYIAGLVGVTYKSEITSSSVKNINVSGGSYVAGLTGVTYGLSTVDNCHVQGIKADGSASYVGGLIGVPYEYSWIYGCSAIDIVATAKTSYVGGFAGAVHGHSIIEDSCVKNVVATAVNGRSAAGFIGEIYEGSQVRLCYAIDVDAKAQFYVGGFSGAIYGKSTVEISCVYGKAATTKGYVAGGFAGYVSDVRIRNCYSQVDVHTETTGGTAGFVGYFAGNSSVYNTYAAGKVTNTKGDSAVYNGAYSGYSCVMFQGTNYYDSDINGALRAYGTGGTQSGQGFAYPQGKTTSVMMQQATFEGWDFDYIWKIDENTSYPYFKCLGCPREKAADEKEKTPPPTINEVIEGAAKVAGEGIANAELKVTFPNGEVVSGTVLADGTWTVDVPTGVVLVAGEVITATQKEASKEESDPGSTIVVPNREPLPTFSKARANLTTAGNAIFVGDTLEYTIKLGNAGQPDSVWTNVVLTDPLPAGVSFVPGSVKMDGVAITEGSGTDQYQYYDSSKTLIVYYGDIGYNVTKTLTFRVSVEIDALGSDLTNEAYAESVVKRSFSLFSSGSESESERITIRGPQEDIVTE